MLLPLLNFGPKGRPWPFDHGLRAPNWLRAQPWWRWLEGGGRFWLGLALVVLSSVVIALLFEVCRQRKTYRENFLLLLSLQIGSWIYFVLGVLFDLEVPWHASNIAMVTVIVSTIFLVRRAEKRSPTPESQTSGYGSPRMPTSASTN